MKNICKILSYVLVAVLSSALTLFLLAQEPETSKLQELSDLIEECFIGEADRTAYEDAAADAMVNALGDRWSYYIPADEYQAHVEQMKNSYVGIGIIFVLKITPEQINNDITDLFGKEETLKDKSLSARGKKKKSKILLELEHLHRALKETASMVLSATTLSAPSATWP